MVLCCHKPHNVFKPSKCRENTPIFISDHDVDLPRFSEHTTHSNISSRHLVKVKNEIKRNDNNKTKKEECGSYEFHFQW